MKRCSLVKAGHSLAPDAFKLVLESESEAKGTVTHDYFRLYLISVRYLSLLCGLRMTQACVCVCVCRGGYRQSQCGRALGKAGGAGTAV